MKGLRVAKVPRGSQKAVFILTRAAYLPGDAGDDSRDHNDHVDETGTHEVSREHPVPLARVLQQVIKTIAMPCVVSPCDTGRIMNTDFNRSFYMAHSATETASRRKCRVSSSRSQLVGSNHAESGLSKRTRLAN